MQAVLRADEPHETLRASAAARATYVLRSDGRRHASWTGRPGSASRFLMASVALHVVVGAGLAWRLSPTPQPSAQGALLGVRVQAASVESAPEPTEVAPPEAELLPLLPEMVTPPAPPAEDPAVPEPTPLALLTGEELVLPEVPTRAEDPDALADGPTLASAARRLRPRRVERLPSPPAPPPLRLRTVPAATPAPRPASPAAAVVAARPDAANRPPPYPTRLVARGWRGSVVLRITVDAQGLAAEVLVVAGSGYPAVDALASEAAWRWRFTPATSANRPTASVVVQRIRFEP